MSWWQWLTVAIAGGFVIGLAAGVLAVGIRWADLMAKGFRR